MKKLSIIIPAHNEERRIERTLLEYGTFFGQLKKEGQMDFEIIVVLNACKDKTFEITEAIKGKIREIFILDLKEAGKGLAIMAGFREAIKPYKKNDLVGFVDADMATRPEEFYRLTEKINDYDGIIASRYMKKSVVNPKPSLRRIIVSRIFNLLIKSLLFMNYKDTQCGAKIFKKKAIIKVLPQLTLSQLAFDVDLLFTLRKNGFKIIEIPTVWGDKEYSTVNFMKSGPKMALSILRLRILNSPFRKLIKVSEEVKDLLKSNE